MILKYLENVPQKILKLLINLQFAISLFFLISFYGICGSILEQERPKQYYIENYNFVIPFLKIKLSTLIFNLGLDHIFTTWWFYILIILFGLSLITCSFTRQLPLFLVSRGNKFFYKTRLPKTYEIYETFSKEKTFFLFSCLQQENYLTFQKRGTFYNYKGLLGKFAPLLVHFSLIIVLLGTSIASLTSFSAQELIAKSESFTINNTVRKSFFSQIPNYSLRVNDFWINYNSDENIQQYFSDISILDGNGEECSEKVISVNKPLQFKNLTVYQTDWDLIALRLKLADGTLKQVPLKKVENEKKNWYATITIQDKEFYLLINNLNGYISIYDNSGKFVKQMEVFDSLDGCKIIEIIPRTGLQLKVDEGIPTLYFGFLFLMISIIFSSQYFPEIWVVLADKENLSTIVGKTNRQQLDFTFSIFKILKKLQKL